MFNNIIICAMLIAMHTGKEMPEKSGIFVDGNISLEIETAYVGGSIADPQKGASFRLSLQGKRENGNKVAIRRGGDNPEVYITGFKYKEKNYSKPGEFIDRIILHHPEEIVINLKQGKYLGENPKIKSVQFRKFAIQDEKAELLVTIMMTTGEKIDIAYCGDISYDGLY